MAHRAVILFLCASGLFQEGLTALIQTQLTVMAALGEEAHFSCRLMQTRDVLQVTWQKCSPGKEKTLATDNKYFGQRVDPYFIGRVEINDGGLQNTSIVIREVTEYDEGCYRCLFNTYPDGALTGLTCLKLYELHGPVLDVRVSNSSEEAVVSCSATGRPAPTVTLSVLQHKVNSSDHVHTNTNGTVTVTRTAVLSRLHNNSAQVECAAQVLSVPPKKVSVTIPEVEPTSSSDVLKAESGSDNYITWVVVVIVLVAIVLIAAILCLWKQQWKRVSQKDPEVIKTPLKSTEDRHETRTPATARGTPLVQQLNEQEGLRLRTSTGKKEDNNVPKVSRSSKVRQELSRLFSSTE